jgi:hypothetical protein
VAAQSLENGQSLESPLLCVKRRSKHEARQASHGNHITHRAIPLSSPVRATGPVTVAR